MTIETTLTEAAVHDASGVLYFELATVTRDESGVEIGRAVTRGSRAPGEDVSDLPQAAQDAAATAWTPDVLDAYAARIAAANAPTTEQVDRTRDRKIAAGFTFNGALFQTDADSVKRIAGAASAAHIAVTLDGAAAGDLRWADPDSDFGWIAEDNSLVPMDAPTVIAFGQAYMAHERALVFAAKAIKDRLRAGEAVDIESAPEWP